MTHRLAVDSSMPFPSFDDRPWQALDPKQLGTDHIRSMITMDEQRYLQWLTQERYTGEGAIVDGGPLLGGSTVAMAEGLRRNARIPEAIKPGRIHSYDLFEFHPELKDPFSGEPEPATHESLLPRFLANTERWRPLIHVYPGDVKGYTWSGGPIEILFIDLAKSWSLQAHLLREFFPHLIPGVSVIIQQDYFFCGCPWIHPVMEALADYLTPVHMPAGPTLGFTLDKAIPAELLQVDYERQLSAKDRQILMERAARRFPGARRLIATTAQVEALVAADDVEGAITVLETVRRSPDFDDTVSFDFHSAVGSVMARLPKEPAAAAGESEARTLTGLSTLRPADLRFLREVMAEMNGGPALAIATAIEDAHVIIGAMTSGRTTKTASSAAHGFTSALDARRSLAGQQIAVAVIDGMPEHPWPTADLLNVLSLMAPGAWVVLRDVSVLWDGESPRHGFGAQLLFDAWPGDKRRSGRIGRVGAIRLPQDLSTVPSLVRAALEQPWEALPAEEVCAAAALPHPRRTSAAILAVQLIRQASLTGRPIYLWGAGAGQRKALDVLRHHDVPVTGFVDRDSTKHGSSIGDVLVHPPSRLESQDGPRPYLGVSGAFANEIVAGLHDRGWQRGLDYAVW